MSKKTALILLLFAAVSLLGYFLLQKMFPAAPSYSANSAGPAGTKAFYLLAKEMGYPVSRLKGSYQQVKGGFIIRVDSPEWSSTFDAATARSLKEWVKNGGTLLLFTTGPSAVTNALGIQTANGEFPGGNVAVRETELTNNVARLSFGYCTYLKLRNGRAEILARDKKGNLALRYKLGRGQVIALASPEPITNGHIEQQDNVIFLVNILRTYSPETVWFDESNGLPAAATEKNPLPVKMLIIALVEAVLALLLLFLYWGRRFGRPVFFGPDEDNVAAEYVNTMANIFRQGQARDIALENIYNGFWRRLTQTLGVAATTGHEAMLNLCRQRPTIDSIGLQRILAAVEKYRARGDLTEAELFSLVNEMEVWRGENIKDARN